MKKSATNAALIVAMTQQLAELRDLVQEMEAGQVRMQCPLHHSS